MKTLLESKEFWALIVLIVGQIFAYVEKKRKDNKNSIKQLELNSEIIKKIEASDEKQTIRINKVEIAQEVINTSFAELGSNVKSLLVSTSKIENDTKELNELHKYTKFSKNILNQIDTEFILTCEIYQNVNPEMLQILTSAKEKYKDVIKNLLEDNFENVTQKKIFDLLKIKAKEIRVQINYNNLTGLNAQYFTDLKEKILVPRFGTFASKMTLICKNQENGVRRENFQKESIYFLQDVLTSVLTFKN